MRYFLSLLLFWGCDSPSDASVDAGTPPIDSGTVDTGTAIDSGTVVDAGETVDSGIKPVPVGWTEAGETPAGEGRWGSHMVYLPDTRQFLLFGGTTYPAAGSVSDLWSFSIDEGTWTELTAMGDIPPARYCHCMTYLPDHHQVLLAGGRDDFGPRLAEAFVLDLATNTWTTITGDLPQGVIGCVSHWMPSLGKAVVWGGGGRNGFETRTWAYDADLQSFEQIPTTVSPPGRGDAASALDEANGRLYVFGGVVRAQPPFEHRDDLWMFDGTDWTELTTPGPSTRRFPATGVDQVNGTWYLFGGTVEAEDRGDLWRFDFASQTWTELPGTDLPDPRGFPASEWDPETGALYLFGGLTQPAISARTDGWRFRPE